MCTDTHGNIFIVGYFKSQQLIFESDTLVNADTSEATFDVFIAKYDSAGNYLWAKTAGGASMDYGFSITADANGDVYIAGVFQSPTLHFGSTSLNIFSSTGANFDSYIAKYNTNGTLLWARSLGGPNNERLSGISSNANGEILVTGSFSGSNFILGQDTLVSNGFDDIFIAKYDANGNALWAKSFGGTNLDNSSAITTDSQGNMIICGAYTSPTLHFGS